jgi:hypothetical protein
MPPAKSETLLDGYKRQWNVISLAMMVMSFPVRVFTIRLGTWGSRYQPLAGFLGCFLWPPLFIAGFGGHARMTNMLVFWLATMGFLVFHKAAAENLKKRGYHCHSEYWGTSQLDRGNSPKSSERARLADGLVMFAVGVLALAAGSEPLGVFLMLGSIAKLLTDASVYQATEARLRQMADARFENEYFAEMFRQRQGQN